MIRGLPILLAALAALLLLLAGAPVAAHGGFVPARPTGLTAEGFRGGIALDHESVSPYVRLDWDDPGDTSITSTWSCGETRARTRTGATESSTATPARPKFSILTTPSRMTGATSTES